MRWPSGIDPHSKNIIHVIRICLKFFSEYFYGTFVCLITLLLEGMNKIRRKNTNYF